jgi:hypothetical protein
MGLGSNLGSAKTDGAKPPWKIKIPWWLWLLAFLFPLPLHPWWVGLIALAVFGLVAFLLLLAFKPKISN